MILRHWLSIRGTLSAENYRVFLWKYALVLMPTMTASFFIFLWLGWQSPEGLLQGDSREKISVMFVIYLIASGWPLVAASVRRMHDLGYRGRERFFTLSPSKTLKLGKELLYKDGSKS